MAPMRTDRWIGMAAIASNAPGKRVAPRRRLPSSPPSVRAGTSRVRRPLDLSIRINSGRSSVARRVLAEEGPHLYLLRAIAETANSPFSGSPTTRLLQAGTLREQYGPTAVPRRSTSPTCHERSFSFHGVRTRREPDKVESRRFNPEGPTCLAVIPAACGRAPGAGRRPVPLPQKAIEPRRAGILSMAETPLGSRGSREPSNKNTMVFPAPPPRRRSARRRTCHVCGSDAPCGPARLLRLCSRCARRQPRFNPERFNILGGRQLFRGGGGSIARCVRSKTPKKKEKNSMVLILTTPTKGPDP